MQELNQRPSKIAGTPIGGWLIVIMIVLIASGLRVVVDLITVIVELLDDNWTEYFQTPDKFLRIRVNIYLFLIISMAIGLCGVVWSLTNFFQRKKRFPAIFLSVLGYFIIIEVLRIYFLYYAANLVGQDAGNIDTGLAKTCVVTILAGLYLTKGKRPNQTFVN
jgi:magnesium-transporting ATPase (P-type)